MPSSLRLGTLLFVGATADLVKPARSQKPAVASLMESAKGFLRNGATPDVVEFADATLDQVSSVVIPAIIDESLSDQRFLYSLHSRFDDIHARLTLDNQEVFQLNAEEQAESEWHKTCRNVEAEACIGKRECEMELWRRWTVWVEEEEQLRAIHETIDGHFCPPGANGTLHTFRINSIPWMEAYMSQKVVVDTAITAYESLDCVTTHDALTHQSAICNSHQTNLEEKACAHAEKINDVLTTYYNDHAQASSTYNCAIEEIMQLEADRKREWVTLQVVKCLLNRVHEVNGRPCDTETGEVDDQVTHCEQRHELEVCDPEEGEPQLCLEYLPIPPSPPDCPARDEVIGICLPVQQPIPCNADWEAQEYAALPAIPQPQFSETNPGCNAYPECVGCPPIVAPHPIIVDSCPGYTVDGCVGSDEEAGEHPLTFVRDVDGVADVRCCSVDGETCVSQDFAGGEDYLRDGAVHSEGCIFEVTYQEAMTVCHAAGMRICTTDEVQACCNTGCWHNHHAIWVNVVDGPMTMDQRYASAAAQAELQ